MKGGLYFIYTSLLTTLVLSSCALFILVVSEVLQTEGEVNPGVDLSGLHNVSQKVSSVSDKDVEPKIPLENYQDTPKDQSNLQEQEVTFADTLSLNSVTTDGLPDTGQPAILISLTDNAKLELKSPDELFFVNDSEKHNDSKTFTLVDSGGGLEEDKDKKGDDKDKESAEPLLVVKAKPMTEKRQIEDAFQTTAAPIEEAVTESQTEDQKKQEKNIPVKTETPQEDIPSFSEWAQKQLAEAEKDTVLNHSSQPSHSNTNISSKSTKLRSKNYASPACGAKIVAVNPEAGSASSILSPNRDEYMLNTCNSRIWFVVELCEAVQAQKIEIANFELFSSIPKDIAVFFSDRFPTRDWASVGQFTAKEIRDIQSFDLYPHLFGKFIKVEMLSHHGSEHYCPISLFKVYGTSEFEVLEKESSQHTAHIDDDDDEIIDVLDVPTAETEPSKNLFGSARDAVMSIMKKAAQALVKTEVPKNVSSEHNDTSSDKMYKRCCSPSHIIVCDNCSETLYNQVYELISCSSDKLTNLVRTVFLRETLKCTQICRPYGLDFKSTKTLEFSEERVNYINALFPPKYLAALCNILAIKEKKVVLNTSFETETNVTTNITIDEGPPKVTSETNPKQEIITLNTNTSTDEKINDTIPSEQISEGIEEKKEATPVEPTKEEIDKTIDKKDEPSVTPEESVSQEQKENIAKKGKEDKKKDLLPDTGNTGDAKSEPESKDMPKPDNKNGKIEGATEKPKENVNVVDEMGEQIIIDSDSFISELDQIAVDPTPAGASATPSQNQAQTIQKESVFLRLSNRVKTLERNMSLSGQYLEELSRRYKKQVEEMQKTFEKTVQQMTEERRKSNEREQKYLEQMSSLQEQLAQMTVAISVLTEDRDSWFGNVTFFKFVVFQVIIVGVVLYYVTKRKKPDPLIVPMSRRAKKKQEKLRRKSVEGVSGHETPSAKKRRPSEEALQIARHSTEDTIREEEGEWHIAKKNRRRKTSIVHRDLDSAISLDYAYNLGSRVNWGRQDSIGELQENPIPLDEEEFIAPVPEPTEFESNVVPKKELPKTNGSIFNNLKPKAMKTRRLSSPAFLRTFSRQSTRSTPSPVVRGLEPVFNGKSKKKSASESPTGSLWSESTELSQNGHLDETGGSKKRKSLKNIFRKVF